MCCPNLDCNSNIQLNTPPYQLQNIVDATVSVFGGASKRLGTDEDGLHHGGQTHDEEHDAYYSYYEVNVSASGPACECVNVRASLSVSASISGSECEC